MKDSPEFRYFSRFERVGSITRIPHDLLVEVEDELLCVDVICDDMTRVKISRGRQFDALPSFAVRADLEIATPEFYVTSVSLLHRTDERDHRQNLV